MHNPQVGKYHAFSLPARTAHLVTSIAVFQLSFGIGIGDTTHIPSNIKD
jgi:hypothetical protein